MNVKSIPSDTFLRISHRFALNTLSLSRLSNEECDEIVTAMRMRAY